MKQLIRYSAVSAVFFLLCSVVFADLERRVSYQGRLNDQGGSPVSGTLSFTFSLYDVDTGGTALWTEAQALTVTNGIFSVQLGSVEPLPYELLSRPDALM